MGSRLPTPSDSASMPAVEAAAMTGGRGKISSLLGEVVPLSHPTVSEVMYAVGKRYGIRQIDMVSQRRAREVSRPRHVAMYLAKRLTPMSLPNIGKIFGDRDHTTVMHACRQVENRMAADPDVRAAVELLERQISEETSA